VHVDEVVVIDDELICENARHCCSFQEHDSGNSLRGNYPQG
jgi:hypothetical protein